jgi:hypothetical protein
MSVDNLNPSRFDVKSWMERPLPTITCVTGWVLATIVFLGFTAWIGGPVEGDAALSVFSTWAIAHGHIACAYSSLGINSLPTLARPVSFIPPLYPLLSAGVLLVVHSTYNVPFPTAAQLGNHCMTANAAMYQWAGNSHAIMPTIRISYLTWFALMSGTIALLRAAGRGRQRWELATLLFLALCAPVFESLTEYFHPQDVLALGLALGSLACALRGRWAWAGILIGLAFTSNQFALLFAGPMLVLAPRQWWIKFTGAAAAAVALISVPVIVLTSGDAFKATVLGSGFTPAKGGGTVLSETDLRGAVLFTIARILPIALAIALAWWAKRRLGDEVLQPIPLLSIIATALALRLVFEFSLYGYFFLGVTTMLVLMDAIKGRVRGYELTWLALVTVLFDPFPWGFASNGQEWGLAAREWFPNVFVIVAVVIILADLVKHRIRWYVVAAAVFVGATTVKWPWNSTTLRQPLPTWIVQIILVSIVIWLAIEPLMEVIRRHRDVNSLQEMTSATP